MHFSLEQSFPGDADTVLAALVGRAHLRDLGATSKVAPPVLLDERRDGDTVVQRTHYRFTGSLSAAVTRVIDPGKLTWIEETTYHLSSRRVAFRIIPDHYGTKLRCAGTATFSERDGVTFRHVEGDLSVKAPLVARLVERAIVSGFEEHLVAEAALLARWLEHNG